MSEGEGEGGHEAHSPTESFFHTMEMIHTGHSLLDLGITAGGGMEHVMGALGAGEHLAQGAEGFSLGFGGALGALNFGKGVGELVNARGNLASSGGSQGGLDMLSGGLGMAAMACPALAPAAAIAGLGAFGNEAAEKNGWYGQHRGADGQMHNETFFGGIGHGAQDGWNWGHNVAGNGIAGNALGAVAGGLSGAGHAIWNSGAALAGAGYRIGEGVSSAAHAVGSGVSSAAHAVGGAASSAFHAVADW